MKENRCSECGGRVCICGSDERGWRAHCTFCDQELHTRDTEQAAVEAWNLANPEDA